MNKTITTTIIIFLFLLVSVSAVKPTQQTIFGNSQLVISSTSRENIIAGNNYTFQVHVYNSSGFLIDNSTTSCKFHLYDINGEHIIEQNMLFSDTDFYQVIPGSNLTVGVHDILVNCNNSEAGYLSTYLRATESGFFEEQSPLLLLAPLILILFFVKLMFNLDKEHILVKLLLLLFSVITLVASANLGIEIAKNNFASTGIINTLSVVYRVSTIFMYLFIAYILIYYVYKGLMMFNEKFLRPK